MSHDTVVLEIFQNCHEILRCDLFERKATNLVNVLSEDVMICKYLLRIYMIRSQNTDLAVRFTDVCITYKNSGKLIGENK